jgi:hypothetical protein
MNPNNDPTDNRPQPVPHQFPPGLEFLASIRKAERTEDPEMRTALLWTVLENVRNFSDLLRQHGYDPERMITTLEACARLSGEVVAHQKELDDHQDQVLHAAADVGEANRKLVDTMEAAVNCAAEERPFDPQVQEWQEQLEELRKHYPKLE